MHPFMVLDAFAEGTLRGNPAAVLQDDPSKDDAWRLTVAAEFNLSETAFVRRAGAGFKLRWFTPRVEIDLCGHATLAAAQALLNWGWVGPGQPLLFETRSGLLRCVLESGRVRMDFPALTVQSTPPPAGLLESLGLSPDTAVLKDAEDYLVLLERSGQVAALRPDFARLAQVDCRGVCVSAPAEAEQQADFVSRFFGPRVGIDEDPVTGSAHCRLGPFWGARLKKQSLTGLQLSQRGGRVGVELNAMNPERLWLSGQVQPFSRGELLF
jgi:PhzF family phenazine biosynthesis protein